MRLAEDYEVAAAIQMFQRGASFKRAAHRTGLSVNEVVVAVEAYLLGRKHLLQEWGKTLRVQKAKGKAHARRG